MTPLSILVGLMLLSVVLLGALVPRRALRSEAFGLLRCLWPSWRFFDRTIRAPELAFRWVEGERLGPWQAAFGPARRKWFSPLLHAEGNLVLAYMSLCERLLEELDGKRRDEACKLVSYQLVQRLLEIELRASAPAVLSYQFSLSEADNAEPLFISDLHALSARAGHA